MIYFALVPVIALTGCDSGHDIVNKRTVDKRDLNVAFKPKPSVSITLYSGWQLDVGGQFILPNNAKNDDDRGSLDEFSKQSLGTLLPQGAVVKHKTPILLERKQSELLESELDLLRYIMVIYENPDDTKAIVDLMTKHPGVETVSVPPDILPAENSKR